MLTLLHPVARAATPRTARRIRRCATAPVPGLFVFLLVVLVAQGCASKAEELSVEARIRIETEAWRGTPYLWGGTSREGIDCSAFTRMMLANQFGIELPRTTAEQRRAGEKVRREDLQAGDLVFFRTTGFGFLFKKQHVGIYLSDGEFAHASGSEGVTISSLNDRYWRRAFRAARRVVATEAP